MNNLDWFNLADVTGVWEEAVAQIDEKEEPGKGGKWRKLLHEACIIYEKYPYVNVPCSKNYNYSTLYITLMNHRYKEYEILKMLCYSGFHGCDTSLISDIMNTAFDCIGNSVNIEYAKRFIYEHLMWKMRAYDYFDDFELAGRIYPASSFLNLMYTACDGNADKDEIDTAVYVTSNKYATCVERIDRMIPGCRFLAYDATSYYINTYKAAMWKLPHDWAETPMSSGVIMDTDPVLNNLHGEFFDKEVGKKAASLSHMSPEAEAVYSDSKFWVARQKYDTLRKTSVIFDYNDVVAVGKDAEVLDRVYFSDKMLSIEEAREKADEFVYKYPDSMVLVHPGYYDNSLFWRKTEEETLSYIDKLKIEARLYDYKVSESFGGNDEL